MSWPCTHALTMHSAGDTILDRKWEAKALYGRSRFQGEDGVR